MSIISVVVQDGSVSMIVIVGSSPAEPTWTDCGLVFADAVAAVMSNLGIFHRPSCTFLCILEADLSIETSWRLLVGTMIVRCRRSRGLDECGQGLLLTKVRETQ
jgi:hypothetical protein